MQRRMIASDFDETLYQQGHVSAGVIDAIRRWRAQGNLFGVATGRSCGLASLLATLAVPYDFLICLNGAEAYDAQGNLLQKKCFDPAPIAAHIPAITRGTTYASIFNGSKEGMLADSDMAGFWQPFIQAGGVSQLSLLYADHETARKEAEAMRLAYPGIDPLLNDAWINAVAHGVSKVTGIEAVQAMFGIANDAVYTAGDNYNDEHMLCAYQGYVIHGSVLDQHDHNYGRCHNIAGLINALLNA